MSYKLNKTDGTLLTDLIDGQIDQSSTNLTLVGRNYSGYGEFFNENFIKLLENFANTAAPSNPLQGQLWWDTSSGRLQVWDGDQWKASGGPFVQDTRPQMVAGDLWIDNENKQLYFYDGNASNDLTLVGPIYNSFQGKSGFEVTSILDLQSRSRPVVKLFVAGELVGAFSNLTFTPIYNNRIPELTSEDKNPLGIIYEGFNIVDKVNFKYRGTAESAEALVNEAGDVVTAAQFLPADAPGTTSGTLTILNAGGLTIGPAQDNVQKVLGNTFVNENQGADLNYAIKVNSARFGNIATSAIFIDAANAYVGIFREDPEYTLDISGDLRVTGNLLVQGNTTSLDVATLKVEDKNIELASLSDSSEGDDAAVDEAGIIIRSSDGSKDFIWKQSTNSWSSNVNLDLQSNRSIKIGGQDKLTNTSLKNIQKALDLNEIGTLQYLNVDQLSLNNSNITASGALSIVSQGGDITINSKKVKGVADPTDSQDAATKNYVDTQIASERVIINLDTTNLSDAQIGFILDSVYPAVEKETDTIGFVITQDITQSIVSNVLVDDAKNVSYTAVDANGTLNESVVQDINFTPADGGLTVLVKRGLKRFRVRNNRWEFVSDVYDDYTTDPNWP